MTAWLWVGAGGFLGAIARYGLSLAIVRQAGGSLPWATLTVNLVGCLLLGLLFGRSEGGEHGAARLFWWIGFLGSFTTFSTFSLETLELWRRGATAQAAGYALGSLVGCVVAVAAGFGLGRWLAR